MEVTFILGTSLNIYNGVFKLRCCCKGSLSQVRVTGVEVRIGHLQVSMTMLTDCSCPAGGLITRRLENASTGLDSSPSKFLWSRSGGHLSFFPTNASLSVTYAIIIFFFFFCAVSEPPAAALWCVWPLGAARCCQQRGGGAWADHRPHFHHTLLQAPGEHKILHL